MKTSLLLMGLVVSVGAVGTAHAANATASASSLSGARNQALVAASTSGSGVLSTLSDLLSGKTRKSTPPASCKHAATPPTDKPKPCQAPRAAHGSTPGPHAAVPGADAPRSFDDANPVPSPASSAEPTLGWQSLLPGSIQ